mgnify:CR=1 FL=1
MVIIKFKGKNIHPGYAKNKMINSIKVASSFIDSLPKDHLSPETTEGREGFVHCLSFEGNEEETTLKFIIRSFDTPKLKEYEDFLRELCNKAVEKFPGAKYDFEIKEQYRNMWEILEKHPQVVDYAKQAISRAGLDLKIEAIRGGTDGSRLSFMGLPTANLFAGEQAIHSKHEFISVQDMNKAVETMVYIAQIWEENS